MKKLITLLLLGCIGLLSTLAFKPPPKTTSENTKVCPVSCVTKITGPHEAKFVNDFSPQLKEFPSCNLCHHAALFKSEVSFKKGVYNLYTLRTYKRSYLRYNKKLVTLYEHAGRKYYKPPLLRC